MSIQTFKRTISVLGLIIFITMVSQHFTTSSNISVNVNPSEVTYRLLDDNDPEKK